MVQTKQSRVTRPNPEGTGIYSQRVQPYKNRGTVATINIDGRQTQKYAQPPRGEKRTTLWKGASHDGLKSRIVQRSPPASETGTGLKLHLGCGGQNWEGFVDIDQYPAFDCKPDVVSDITDLPYKEDTVDEIWLIHVFEHIFYCDADDAIASWYRILKPGGKLVIEVPCMDKIINNYNKREMDPRLTILGIFGEQLSGQPEMVHKWCYTKNSLKGMLEDAGFKTAIKDPVYHLIKRDMRAEGIKLCHI